ncbi:MAG: anthranilate synthase component I [Chloroflexota bacterium]|nr:anthranilate synthase component I [Chloroflexota bacterium]
MAVPVLPHVQVPTHAPAPVLPTFEEFAGKATSLPPHIKTFPVYREIMADLETPVSAYLKLSDGGRLPGFLLESVEGGTRIARYSFLGTEPLATVTMNDGHVDVDGAHHLDHSYADPLVALGEVLAGLRAEQVAELPLFTGGAVGHLSYEAITTFEPRVKAGKGEGLTLPEGRFHLVDTLLVFDHLARTIKVVSHVYLESDMDLQKAYGEAVDRIDRIVRRLEGPVPPIPLPAAIPTSSVVDRFRANTSADRYREMVSRAKEYIQDGDIIQVVLSQRIDVDTPVHPFQVYRALRTVNPSPYMFYLDFVDYHVVGASPELLVRLEDGVITNHPIAGTRPRGETAESDTALAVELLNDEKERAEHIMLVDLGRNDVGRVAKPGTVRVPKLMEVERFSHVMHLVSHVVGELREDLTGLDALRACFPAGTVSGAPKVRAMEIISELETDRRGVYAGAVGYVDLAGGMDTCIALRTMVVRDGVASLQAGGGIVADSTPEGEYAESFHKMRALVRAIERAEATERARLTAQPVRTTA